MRTVRIFTTILLSTVLVSFTIDKPCGETPLLNKKVIEFVNANMGKKVGVGECWDVASGALDKAGAIWDGNYKFGKEVDYKKTCIFPGDIVQFEGVVLTYTIEDASYTETLLHHTAIIYSVKEKGEYTIADQNTKANGKKVATHAFAVKNVVKGKFTIYRPQN